MASTLATLRPAALRQIATAQIVCGDCGRPGQRRTIAYVLLVGQPARRVLVCQLSRGQWEPVALLDPQPVPEVAPVVCRSHAFWVQVSDLVRFHTRRGLVITVGHDGRAVLA